MYLTARLPGQHQIVFYLLLQDVSSCYPLAWQFGRERTKRRSREVFQLSLSHASRGFGAPYCGFPAFLILENRQATQISYPQPEVLPWRFAIHEFSYGLH